MHRLRRLVLLSLFCLSQIYADEITAPPSWQVALTAGFNSVAAQKNSLLSDNRGAELGILTTLPLQIFHEHYNLVAVRAQVVQYPNAIETASPTISGETVKLTNAAHSRLRADFRQIYEYWGIHWSFGLGIMLPLTSTIATPRGEYSFSEARNVYASAATDIRKIDSSTAVFVRLGIDQKILGEAMLLGLGIDINVAEFPRTDQRVALNLYAGVRVW